MLLRANEVKEKTKKAAAKEKVQVEVAGSFDESGKFNIDKLKENLKANLGFKNEDITNNENESIKIKIDGYEMYIFENGNILNEVKPGEVIAEENGVYMDKTGIAIIPEGFVVSQLEGENTIENGLVIYNIPKGENINWKEDENKNNILDVQEKYDQYVWIPCDNIKLSRRIFTSKGSNLIENSNVIENSYYGEENPKSIISSSNQENYNYTINAFLDSCIKYNGFFVGRYEACKENNDDVVVKRSTEIYNNISPTQALEKSQKETSVYIRSMINSFAWDTMLEFICQNNGYNLSETTDSNYGNINSRKVYNSGTYKVGSDYVDCYNNIYDVIGNVREWTTEYSTHSRGIYVNRGGYFDNNVFTVKERRPYNNEAIYPSFGFRTILYIK